MIAAGLAWSAIDGLWARYAELPEVEYGRKQAEEALVGKRITRVDCADDEIVFAGVKPSAVAAHLKGQTVRAALSAWKIYVVGFAQGTASHVPFWDDRTFPRQR